MSYEYLFPYEKIPYLSKILIYGAGELGQDYLLQMEITHYCEVVAIADKNYEKYPCFLIPVISPMQIYKYEFDFVVVAIRMEAALPEMLRVLKEQGICEEKIVYVFERQVSNISIMQELVDDDDEKVDDVTESKQSIAILTTGGFGDMVIQKRFISELIKYAPECKIDLYNIKAIDFLRYLYSDTENVYNVFDDLGYRYNKRKNKYGLSLTIEACHFIRVDTWDENKVVEDFPPEFALKVRKLKNATEREGIGVNTPAYLTLTRRRFKGLNAYSGFNYYDAFIVDDKKVSIPLDESFSEIFNELGLENYITVNYGNGDSKTADGIAKSWSKEAFETVIHGFKKRFPKIKVVQIGEENAAKMKGVDYYVLGEDFRLVLHVLKNSIFHLDIEGGLVHIASQIGTKCIVLFGPTVPDYYGYEQNINIRTGECRECWGLYSNVNRCARDMKDPICMKQITPEMVLDKIDKYMEVVGCQK